MKYSAENRSSIRTKQRSGGMSATHDRHQRLRERARQSGLAAMKSLL